MHGILPPSPIPSPTRSFAAFQSASKGCTLTGKIKGTSENPLVPFGRNATFTKGETRFGMQSIRRRLESDRKGKRCLISVRQTPLDGRNDRVYSALLRRYFLYANLHLLHKTEPNWHTKQKSNPTTRVELLFWSE